MTTQEAIKTTLEVANRFYAIAQQGDWAKIQNELFSDDAVSIEPPNAQGPPSVEGLDSIRKKGEMFQSMVEELHSHETSKPVVAGHFFSVSIKMDVTMNGRRNDMQEIAVYEVRNGKIVKEQFFF